MTHNTKGGGEPLPNACTCDKGEGASYHENDCATRFEPTCTALNHQPNCGHLPGDGVPPCRFEPRDASKDLVEPTPQPFLCSECGYTGRRHAKLCPENPEAQRKATPTEEFMATFQRFLDRLGPQDRDNWIAGITFRLERLSTDDFLARLYEAACAPPEPQEESFQDLLATYTEAKRERDRHDSKMRMAYDSLLPRALDAFRARFATNGEQLVAIVLKGFSPGRSYGVQASMTNAEARAWVQAACLAYANQNLTQYGHVQSYRVLASAARKDDQKQ